MVDQLEEDHIKKEGRIRALNSDYPIIKHIRTKLKVPDPTVTKQDMMPYLDRINRW